MFTAPFKASFAKVDSAMPEMFLHNWAHHELWRFQPFLHLYITTDSSAPEFHFFPNTFT